MTAPVSLGCVRARAALQARLDEGPAGGTSPADRGALIDHLAACAACRELATELTDLQEALRSAPFLPFPADALEAVWDRTVRAADRRRGHGRRAAALWGGLAAAGLLGALLLAAPRTVPVPQGPTEEEVLRAAADLRFVLRLTDAQIQSQGGRALHEVLDEEVAPALRRAEHD